MIAIGGPLDGQDIEMVNGVCEHSAWTYHKPPSMAARQKTRYVAKEYRVVMVRDLWFPTQRGFHRFIEWEEDDEWDLRYYGWGEKWRTKISRIWKFAVLELLPPSDGRVERMIEVNQIIHDEDRIEKIERISDDKNAPSAWRFGYSAYPAEKSLDAA